MSNSLGDVLKEALARKWAEDDAAHKQMEAAKPDGKQLFRVVNNVSRATFDHIKTNPGTRVETTKALVAKGFKASSITALVGQMLRNGMIVLEPSGLLKVAQSEYTPIKSPKQLKKLKQQKKTVVTKRPVSALPAAAPGPVPMPVLGWSANEILENLDVKQAVAVYKELKKLFGEVQ